MSDLLKKALVALLVPLMLLLLTGCGAREKISDQITKKITEGVIEKVAGDDADLDLDDGKLKLKGDDGSEWSIGGDEWPEGDAADLIPEFKKGNITSVLNSPEGCWINIEGVDEKDFQRYVEDLKKAGFNSNVLNYSYKDSVVYSAELAEKATVMVTYSQDGVLIIQASIEEGE